MTICNTCWPLKTTSCVFIPTNENTSVSPDSSGTVRVKFPSTSLTTPTAEPFSRMVTPGNGRPSLSFTFPVRVIFFWGTSGCLNFGEITMILSSNRYHKPVFFRHTAIICPRSQFCISTLTFPVRCNISLLYTKWYPVCSVSFSNTSCKETSFTEILIFTCEKALP